MLSSNQVVYFLIIYLHYHSAFTSEAPHGCLQTNTLTPAMFHTLHTWYDNGISCCTIDHYANFWKNTHRLLHLEQNHLIKRAVLHTTLTEQMKALSNLSTYQLPYFVLFYSFFN